MPSGRPDFTLSVATSIIFGQLKAIVNFYLYISLLILSLILLWERAIIDVAPEIYRLGKEINGYQNLKLVYIPVAGSGVGLWHLAKQADLPSSA